MPTILSRKQFGTKKFSSVTSVEIIKGKTTTGIVGVGLETTKAKSLK